MGKMKILKAIFQINDGRLFLLGLIMPVFKYFQILIFLLIYALCEGMCALHVG